MVRKCGRGISEIEVMEVGVRTRSRAALAMADVTRKKRKVKELARSSSKHSSMTLQKASFERRISPEIDAGARTSRCSDLNCEAQVSCCSNNCGSSEIADDHQLDDDRQRDRLGEARQGVRFVDLKDDESNEVETSTYNSCRERREMTPSSKLREESDGLESSSKMTLVNSDRRSSSTLADKMPSESELEEFFAEAEKEIQTRFAKKYNYDIVKDTPLEGRYEWVRLKP